MRLLKVGATILALGMLIVPLIVAQSASFGGCSSAGIGCVCSGGVCSDDGPVCYVLSGECVIRIATSKCTCARAVTE